VEHPELVKGLFPRGAGEFELRSRFFCLDRSPLSPLEHHPFDVGCLFSAVVGSEFFPYSFIAPLSSQPTTTAVTMPPKQQDKKAIVKSEKLTQGEKKKIKNDNKAKANPEKAAAKKEKNDATRLKRYVH
jgi:hypothetical protein